ncbi:MAG: sulfite exporter TauE/SafE family protein, partial [Planctomycetota bacterium]|nr:sulfite exporter TauE/SafE family protein [Planctomycetota bacterium]
PSMAVVSLLGMNPTAAFPIMMGSAALILPAAALRFVKTGRYDRRTALGLTLGGIPGVLIAAFLVKSLPLDAVRWIVVGVLVYTSMSMWLSARNEARRASAMQEETA